MPDTRRANDRRTELLALACATLIIAQQVAGKAVRDALFLTEFDVERLPMAMVAAGVLSIGGALGMARLLARFGPARVIPAAFAMSALLYVLEWRLLHSYPLVATVLFYLHITALGATLISGFWSVLNERFDPHSAKTTFAHVAAAATLGGVLGGLATRYISESVDVGTLLIMLSAMHGLAIILVYGIGTARVVTPQPALATEMRSAIPLLGESRYLQGMVVLVTGVGVTAALVDYAFKAEVSARYDQSSELVGFFALFYSVTGIVAFLMQSLLGRRALDRLGLAGTLAVLPAAIVITGLAGTVLARFWTAIVMRGAQAILAHTFFRSGFELLYAPLPRHTKRPTKTVIDVGADRLGDILGGGILILLIATLSTLSSALVMSLAILAATFVLIVVVRLNRGYVEQLAESLRARPLTDLEERPQRPTRDPMVPGGDDTTAGPARLQAQKNAAGTGRRHDPGARTDAEEDPLLRSIRLIRHGTVEELREVLQHDDLAPELITHIIALLEEPELVPAANLALKRIACLHTGQLVDAMLDHRRSESVRRRLPRSLEDCATPRAAAGLLNVMENADFEIRYRCARVLSYMKSQNRNLEVRSQQVFSLVRREAERSAEQWAAQVLHRDRETPGDLAPTGHRRTLEYIFMLLGVVLDSEVMRLSMHALTSEDTGFKGTALEYLGHVLTDEIRLPLMVHVRGEPSGPQHRPAPDVVKELVDGGRSLLQEKQEEAEFPVHIRGTYTVVVLSGEIDLEVSPRVRTLLLKYIDHGRDVLVDMAGVSYMDSSAVASLVEALQRSRKMGVKYKLVGAGPPVLKVLQLARLDRVFEMHQTLEAAL